MAKQKKQKTEKKKKSFLYNLGLLIIVSAVLYWAFFVLLNIYTRHGKSLATPSLIGLSLEEANKIIKENNLAIDVDSSYDADIAPLIILSQRPDSGFRIKKEHTIAVTVNKILPPSIPMPSLINLSYRSALMLLETSKLKLKDTVMRPDIAQGAVLDQLFKGNSIQPGSSIPQGSEITLVVGFNAGSFEIDVPNVVGLSYAEAIALLSGNNLNYYTFFEGHISDTTNAVVFEQDPEQYNPETLESNKIEEGMVINLFIKQQKD